jgi:hypothetical protein
MKMYVKRLINCGYSRRRAWEVCEQFVRNLPLVDLDFFVQSVEARYVDIF